MTVKVATNEVFYQGDFLNKAKYNAGVYIVEVQAWTDNNYDTGFSQQLRIEIVDPCSEMIEPSSKYLPEQTYYIGSGNHVFSVQKIAENAFRPVKDLCGDVNFEVELYDVILINDS